MNIEQDSNFIVNYTILSNTMEGEMLFSITLENYSTMLNFKILADI